MTAAKPRLESGSPNGMYYTCTFPTSNDECIFDLTGQAPSDWQDIGAVEHNTDFSPCGFNNGGSVCQVVDYNGKAHTLSPKPWQNGDDIVVTGVEQTGDAWTYVQIFELVAPLRNLMMYHPGDGPEVWDL